MHPLNGKEGVSRSEGGVTGGEGAEAHTDSSVGSGAGDIHDYAVRLHRLWNEECQRIGLPYTVPANEITFECVPDGDVYRVTLRHDPNLHYLRLRNRL